MATPTTNAVPTTDVDADSTGLGHYEIGGTKWGGGLGRGVTLTYSFPVGSASHASPYGGSEWSGWSSLSGDERSAIKSVLATYSSFINVKFAEVADNADVVGEFRFVRSSALDADEAAHAYLPGDYAAAGDVWFNTRYFNVDGTSLVERGGYDFLTILHETGHALGLIHPFEANPAIPEAKDNYFYSIMSYTASASVEFGDNYASFYPTTPMFYDLVALEALYGRNTSVHAGNDTYTFKDGTHYWQAINDGGGTDTIVYSGSEASSIDLNPGHFSRLSESIKFSDGSSSRATVTIGPNVVIENAVGGSGNDGLVGNAVANHLSGKGGNDILTGGAGNDVLDGGTGADKMSGGVGNDTYVVDNTGDVTTESAGGGTDTVQSTISLTLKAEFENLKLVGTAAINGTGNAAANVVIGNAAANTIHGGAGNDVLYGNAGNDRLFGDAGHDIFVFNTAPSSKNVDTIGDFNVADDTIKLENAVFKALTAAGHLAEDLFWSSRSGAAHEKDDRVIYDTDNGWLNYDANGNASGGSVHFATLKAGLHLTSDDFIVT